MSPLPTRKLGNAAVTAIGYGAMGLSAFYGIVKPDEERLKFLDTLYESGCTFWDSSDAYKDNEDLLGKWFARTGMRGKIFLATKIGQTGNVARPVNGEPEYIRNGLEKSLKRLQTDHIDLWYIHRVDKTVPIEVTVSAMAEEVKAGRVKYLGLSECSAETLRRAHATHPITALQIEFSPFTLDLERSGLVAAARELGVALVAYAPLGRGILTGRFSSPDDFVEGDLRRLIPKYSRENFPRIQRVVDALQAIGTRHNATPAQVALAWVVAQGFIPIPGTTRTEALHENLAALNLKLTSEEVADIRHVAEEADATLQGGRYPPFLMALLDADTPPLQR
ncbi:aldo/keto reductase [Phanerochaete sordida]|uniref:Aldo/keto reductase n=1 Tax=Phanerochaete sordida TaxID=48140 RepID=A0A9P3GF54_9APHY|nr:aldo/keto reductase [Phanerochaete sordida]